MSNYCHAYQTPQGCKSGAACKFLHERVDTSHNGAQSGAQYAGNGNASTSQQEMWAWKRMLGSSATRVTDPMKLSKIFQTAARLASGEPGSRHEVLQALASEQGLARINDLMQHGQASGYSAKTGLTLKYFHERFVPLFKTITNPDVLSSFVLEKYRNDIFVFLYGPRGSRLEKLLLLITGNFTEAIGQQTQSDENSSPASLLKAFMGSLGVIFHVIELNGNAQINPKIPPLVKELGHCTKMAHELEGRCHGSETVSYLSRIEERLGIGQSIPQYTPAPPLDRPDYPTFRLNEDFPGDLSPGGRRHDNDFADIKSIQILPTMEEIRSIRTDYLPTTDPLSWHQSGIKGLLDRQFRLLREDTVGQLRDVIHEELNRMEESAQPASLQSNRQLLRSSVYRVVQLDNISLDYRDGLRLDISFQQPSHIRLLTATGREEWWSKARRLQSDALVCLIDGHDLLLFCTVCELDGRQLKKKTRNLRDITVYDAPVNPGDLSSAHRSRTVVKLCDVQQHYVQSALNLHRSGQTATLVEFPGVILPAFKHTLEALQQMSVALDVPFIDILAPSTSGHLAPAPIAPPLYSLKPKFKFPLRRAMYEDDGLHLVPGSAFDVASLAKSSSLDLSQSQAIVDALTRSFSLIQGPPGTGKSYTGIALIRILLDSRKRGDLGPILCVCYTNHALDQLLEHLIADGVEQIIRVGSRSKSDVVRPLNLSVVSQKVARTKVERNILFHARGRLGLIEKDINELLKAHATPDSWRMIKNFLLSEYPEHHLDIFGSQDKEGFEIVRGQPNTVLSNWVNRGLPVPDFAPGPIEPMLEKPIKELTWIHRRQLVIHWKQASLLHFQQNLSLLIRDFTNSRTEHDKCSSDVKLRCLQDANIIGITTSGLARNLDLLRRVRCKVMVCEEAGEVLEAHMLTALLPSVEHAILIGDHLQLRPSVQRYDLSSESAQGSKYALNLSLFERLAQPGDAEGAKLPFSTLETQRRMHPSISRLIRTTLYPALQDGDAVAQYPRVIGMKHRLMWFDHTEPENGANSQDPISTSRTNEFEVEMAAALASHLIRQGSYKPNEIAVLTPYLGQLHRLRATLGHMFELVLTEHDIEQLEQAGLEMEEQVSRVSALKALKVATVDNFQGEEAKVVIVSLVRSNPENKVGFLRTSNRINVLLSRAQHGMYIMGNSTTAESVQMWHDIIGMLKEDDLVKPDLELECPRHPTVVMKVRHPEGFQQLSPEGGCDQQCGNRLACGHACINRCHSDILHNAVVCLEPCQRARETCSHPCPKKCGETCPDECTETVVDPGRTLPCGHLKTRLPCWQSQESLSKIICGQKVRRTIPGCRHEVDLGCYISHAAEDFTCSAVCGIILPCGHTCKKKCHQCVKRSDGQVTDEDHGTCVQKCDRFYTTCRHRCKNLCHGDQPCPLCDSACDVACVHSGCSRKCHEPCTPCTEQVCASHCPHSECTMPCAAPCDWIPCNKRCQSILQCGHQCPTLCGEVCPSPTLCQLCCTKDIRKQIVDFSESKLYADVDLDEEPCIFPSCGHIMTLTSMDGHMSMGDHYKLHSDGSIDCVNTSVPFSDREMKSCPSCRGPLRNLARYGRIVRRTLLDESTKKLIVWSTANLGKISDEFHDLEVELIDTARDVKIQIPAPDDFNLKVDPLQVQLRKAARCLLHSKRYDAIFKLRNKLQGFMYEVSVKEQPFNRVWQLCEDAGRRRQSTDTFKIEDVALQTRCRFDAVALFVRCDLTIVSDLADVIHNKVPHTMVKNLQVDLKYTRDLSERLLMDAHLSKRITNQTEAHMFLARCASLELGVAKPSETDDLLSEAYDHLEFARNICTEHPGSTRGMMKEIEAIEKSLSGTFYSVATSDERIEVLRAKASEFSGRGHWYYCQNGHPFSVGERGGPMQETRCPECDASVGGEHHQAVAGVTLATNLKAELRDLQLTDRVVLEH